jgi:hypothetical protein
MIISKIQGGLGNQMFQYAHGRHLSKKYNTKLYLDSRFYKYQSHRSFLLDKFNTDIDTNLDMITANYPIQVVGDNFIFKELSNPIDCNYYLDGYWQSEKYFNDIRDIILEEFTPKENLKLNEIPLLDTNTVSIHVRRTDYITSNGYHPVQDIKYYEEALSIIGQYDYIFCFSDDIEWCKENLKFNNIVFMGPFSEIKDMFVMSLCKNNIIANSTFSWWAAWLNRNPDKKIIAPQKWFGDNVEIDTKNIIPESWIKI